MRAHEFGGKGILLLQVAWRETGELSPQNAGVPQTSEELANTLRKITECEQDVLMEKHMSKHLHFKHIREN